MFMAAEYSTKYVSNPINIIMYLKNTPFQMLYLCFGTHQVVTSDCKNLEQKLDLYLDGKQIELPELQSIVVLNIPSWGAGVNLWGMFIIHFYYCPDFHEFICCL